MKCVCKREREREKECDREKREKRERVKECVENTHAHQTYSVVNKTKKVVRNAI